MFGRGPCRHRLVAQVVLRREVRHRLVQQLEVIVGVVRAGVARTQHRPERLLRSCRTRREGMKAEALLARRRASCLSENAVTSVASKSMVMSPGGAAAHTISRAAATAFWIWRSSSDAVAFTALQAVEIEATSPNSSDCDRSVSKSLSSRPDCDATAR